MAQHDVEITISRTGEVKVHVRGAKGKACMEYAKWLTKVIGRVKDEQKTSEFYEPEVKSRIDLRQDLRVEDDGR
jgi:hypothetical protein